MLHRSPMHSNSNLCRCGSKVEKDWEYCSRGCGVAEALERLTAAPKERTLPVPPLDNTVTASPRYAPMMVYRKPLRLHVADDQLTIDILLDALDHELLHIEEYDSESSISSSDRSEIGNSNSHITDKATSLKDWTPIHRVNPCLHESFCVGGSSRNSSGSFESNETWDSISSVQFKHNLEGNLRSGFPHFGSRVFCGTMEDGYKSYPPSNSNLQKPDVTLLNALRSVKFNIPSAMKSLTKLYIEPTKHSDSASSLTINDTSPSGYFSESTFPYNSSSCTAKDDLAPNLNSPKPSTCLQADMLAPTTLESDDDWNDFIAIQRMRGATGLGNLTSYQCWIDSD
ncbi:hypothetical protein K439DRAFT_1658422 [Ramaria rubella]|nr:hypothetical protein K439DRAFT_1658422 [Ramaria rubella]